MSITELEDIAEIAIECAKEDKTVIAWREAAQACRDARDYFRFGGLQREADRWENSTNLCVQEIAMTIGGNK